jgi:tRNA 2-selenouridine synthase
MQTALTLEIEVPLDERVSFLLRDYAYFTQDPADLKTHLAGLRNLLGQEQIKDWHERVDQGDFRTLTESLLHRHYDPLYTRARQRDYHAGQRQQIITRALSQEAIDQLANQLLLQP